MQDVLEYNICDIVRKIEQDYTSGIPTKHSKYVDIDQYENINKIDAYLNSKHISGPTDSKLREKPFFDIVTAATNIWYRATDIDRKNIRIKPTKLNQYVAAYIATIHLQEWMRRNNFGAFLNDWGRSLARYGSSVVKFVEKDGELIPLVVPWNRLMCDSVEFEGNPVVEKLSLTPGQLRRKKEYDQEMVKQLLETLESREDLEGNDVDNKSDYIELYEIHGEISKAYLTGEEKDADEYVQQMQVVSFVAKKEEGEYDDFTLYSGKEKDPYMITHLIKEDGRTQAIGAVEHLFEAQWMMNHTAKAIKDQLDLASQLIFQTSDGSFAGRNALTSIMTGDILIHDGNPLTQVANNSHDIASLQNFGNQWQALAREMTSTPEAISGATMPSGTAYRQVAMLNQEAHSLFEIMTENKGLHIEEMLRRFIIPHLKTKMDTTDELAVTFDSQGIQQFDAMYVPSEAIRRENDRIIEGVLSGELMENSDLEAMKSEIQTGLNAQGSQRFIKPSDIDGKTWKEVLEDLEWEVECEITDEAKDKQAVLDTLSTVLKDVATNPQILQDPTMKLVFTRIIEETGAISSVELSQLPPSQPPVPEAMPAGGAPLSPPQNVK